MRSGCPDTSRPQCRLAGPSLAVVAMAAVLLRLGTAGASDTLRVGEGDLRWSQIMRSATHLQVAGDSVWTWSAPAGTNLAPASAGRGGGVRANTNYTGGYYWQNLQDLDRLVDGDAGTAWTPDDEPRVDRQVEVEIDLGAVFGIDRVRLMPRLDREHRDRILGDFEVWASDAAEDHDATEPGNGRRLFGFSQFYPNRESVVDWPLAPRNVRYLYLVSRERELWEVAELEVYADGTVPPGVFVSVPLYVRAGYPVWGRAWTDAGELADLPLVLETRSGPDREPEHYFLQTGDELEQVSREQYLSMGNLPQFGTLETVQGPILPNPEWSPWETVSDGVVRSPAPRRYLQFRLTAAAPGVRVGRLFFEYTPRPPAVELLAEISPLVARAGEMTDFTLSMEVRVDPGRGDTGFRNIVVETAAAAPRVTRVLVDDREAVHTTTYREGEGFTVNLWRRVCQSGTYVEIHFQAAVVRDGTSFLVRALDVRPLSGQVEEVYQTAEAADVEPLTVGGELVVRLESDRVPLVAPLASVPTAFSPNGDGVNDVLKVTYDLMKLTLPVSVHFEIFALDGTRVRRGQARSEGSGRHVALWDGRDDLGARVPPGLYVCRLRADTDAGVQTWQGVVGVTY